MAAPTPKPSDAPNLWIACRRVVKPLRAKLRTADGHALDEYMLDAYGKNDAQTATGTRRAVALIGAPIPLERDWVWIIAPAIQQELPVLEKRFRTRLAAVAVLETKAEIGGTDPYDYRVPRGSPAIAILQARPAS